MTERDDAGILDNVVDAAEVRFALGEDHHVHFVHGGRDRRVSAVIQAFPLSNKGRMVAVRDADGAEIALLDDVHKLDPASRKILDREIEKAYFMPVIEDLLNVTDTLGVLNWTVETDRGRRVFQIKNLRRNIRRIGRERVVIRDVDGNRYEVRDLSKLPLHAQDLLDQYL
jgi:hypothetical protein